MILGEPTLQAVLDLLRDEVCTRCGEFPDTIGVNGPSEIVLECGHVVDAKAWIDANRAGELDASELLEGVDDA